MLDSGNGPHEPALIEKVITRRSSAPTSGRYHHPTPATALPGPLAVLDRALTKLEPLDNTFKNQF